MRWNKGWVFGLCAGIGIGLTGGNLAGGSLAYGKPIEIEMKVSSEAGMGRAVSDEGEGAAFRKAKQVIRVGGDDTVAVPAPDSLKAGTKVEGSDIRKNGISAYFTASAISDEVFDRMYGKSYKEDCIIPREDLRYLRVLYCGLDGQSYVGEMVCHKDISQDLLEIFQELYDNFYQIEKMVLVDDYDGDDLKSAADNNTSCFNYRISSGNSGTLSYHALGKALDINPLYNPYLWTDRQGNARCEPEEGQEYRNREGSFPCKIEEDDLCCLLFKAHGFTWGGSWQGGEKDYMHFSKVQ